MPWVPSACRATCSVAAAGGQQRDVLRAPALVQQYVDLVVVADAQAPSSASHGTNRTSGPSPPRKRIGGRPAAGRRGDLAGVADVLVENQRDQWHRRPLAVEDPLAFVAEHARLPASGRAARSVAAPTNCRRSHGLVDDDRVEPVAVGQAGRQVLHLGGQVVFEELRGLGGALRFVGPSVRPT